MQAFPSHNEWVVLQANGYIDAASTYEAGVTPIFTQKAYAVSANDPAAALSAPGLYNYTPAPQDTARRASDAVSATQRPIAAVPQHAANTPSVVTQPQWLPPNHNQSPYMAQAWQNPQYGNPGYNQNPAYGYAQGMPPFGNEHQTNMHQNPYMAQNPQYGTLGYNQKTAYSHPPGMPPYGNGYQMNQNNWHPQLAPWGQPPQTQSSNTPMVVTHNSPAPASVSAAPAVPLPTRRAPAPASPLPQRQPQAETPQYIKTENLQSYSPESRDQHRYTMRSDIKAMNSSALDTVSHPAAHLAEYDPVARSLANSFLTQAGQEPLRQTDFRSKDIAIKRECEADNDDDQLLPAHKKTHIKQEHRSDHNTQAQTSQAVTRGRLPAIDHDNTSRPVVPLGSASLGTPQPWPRSAYTRSVHTEARSSNPYPNIRTGDTLEDPDVSRGPSFDYQYW